MCVCDTVTMAADLPEITIKDEENEFDSKEFKGEYEKIYRDAVEYTTPIIKALNGLPVYYRYHFKNGLALGKGLKIGRYQDFTQKRNQSQKRKETKRNETKKRKETKKEVEDVQRKGQREEKKKKRKETKKRGGGCATQREKLKKTKIRKKTITLSPATLQCLHRRGRYQSTKGKGIPHLTLLDAHIPKRIGDAAPSHIPTTSTPNARNTMLAQARGRMLLDSLKTNNLIISNGRCLFRDPRTHIHTHIHRPQ